MILKRITSSHEQQVYFITDQYLENSIKSCERNRRGASGDVRITAARKNQPSPKQIKIFLSTGKNKTDFVWFLMKDWSQEDHHKATLLNKELLITVEDQTFAIRVQDELKSVPVNELCSSQEEADTKIFLTANYAGLTGQRKALIITVDSDVAVLACYYTPFINLDLLVRIGTGNNVRYLNPISLDVDDSIKLALPALHAISRCDFVGSLNCIGKSKWMKLMQNDDCKSALALLREDVEISERVLETIETIVCKLYGTNKTSITEARFTKFCKKSMPDPCILPSTKG